MNRLCDHWTDGRGYCRSAEDVRYFVVGWRCPIHTPAVLAGREDLVPDPLRTLQALRRKAGRIESYNPSDTALNDERAIVKGKRRSKPNAYRAARAAEDERKAARHA